MEVDPNSHVPIYLQIAERIRAAIAAGIYRPGEALPSLRVLALEVKVNPNTVQRAYDTLLREGTVNSQRGKGLFVADHGAVAALDETARAVARALGEAVRIARSAGMGTRQIQALVAVALKRSRDAGEATS